MPKPWFVGITRCEVHAKGTCLKSFDMKVGIHKRTYKDAEALWCRVFQVWSSHESLKTVLEEDSVDELLSGKTYWCFVGN